MPENRIFNEVELAYAVNFAPVETARKFFLEARTRLLDELEAIAKATFAGRRGLEVDRWGRRRFSREDGDDGFALYLSGKYTATRQDLKRSEKRSGVEVGLYEWEGPLACQISVFFELGRGTFDQLDLEFKDGSARVPFDKDLQVFRHKGSVHLRAYNIAPDSDSFSRESVSEQIRRLPEKFDKADDWLAKRYKQLHSTEPKAKRRL